MGVFEVLNSIFGGAAPPPDLLAWARVHQRLDALLAELQIPFDDALPADVAQLVGAGRTIEAIKAYRDATGAGLADARAAVAGQAQGTPAAAVRKLDALLSKLGIALPATPADDEIREMIAAGRMVDAIRRLREIEGLDLRDAKLRVDALAAEMNPDAGAAQ